ncbi:MAG: Molybdopterin oxidoreductase, catalytic subunit A [Hydrogenibacillus schlegelii]|uniref:Molybdopterin oxidoreductase, catalytic subunit A n=1 Tax=Hydrogenibacillus schlegelii TaxID=1484 RepID=A0A2T5GET1_HYDSH|nr:molybdopterin-dependent oxidoreductase [Hydrogenibacillus schlegelii]PTQ54694.1 MAG: Molybdopterin oxidoreductase, catalytic subunit A [Hydrogenibacillus schlegelii]
MVTMKAGRFQRFGKLHSFPPPERWDDWAELDAKAWPKRVERRYKLIPTVCFNCEAACGLLAYIDQKTGEIRKLEGHPLHPASRGRNCGKGPATLTQVKNPDRILYPLKRTGARGEGKWTRVSWDEALDDIAARIRKALQEGRRDEVIYHVGRPGEDLYTERVLMAWGVDGHNSHTNVCSSGARVGYATWMGIDRPAPDHPNARFILLMSSHLESGHYFNPHAQRIIEAKERGAKIAVIDTRLSNTANKADYWLSPWPGTEAALLLAIANVLIQNDWFDREFVRKWVNWDELLEDQEYLQFMVKEGWIGEADLPKATTFDAFVRLLKALYRPFTPEWAAEESGVRADVLVKIAEEIRRAGSAFSSHIWRNAAAGHRGGWMIARALFFLNVLSGSVATPGGTIPNAYVKFVPKPFSDPHGNVRVWSTIQFPDEFPLAYFEMSFMLPHLLKDKNKRFEVYFTRVVNPVWTFTDGFSWIEMLTDPNRVGLHVALTPTWNETAQYADYVLPMGLAPERHDLFSYETHAAQWIGFRQPVLRVLKEKEGQKVTFTYEANPGEVWEENEFWIELSWRIDPDGKLGIRKYFESPYRPGEKITIEAYYRWIFENSVPGLPEAAAKEGLTPMEYMRKYGVFTVTEDVYREYEKPVPEDVLKDARIIPDREAAMKEGAASGTAAADPKALPLDVTLPGVRPGVWTKTPPPKVNFRPYPGPFKNEHGEVRVGIVVDGKPVQGFPTPSGKLEFFSTTLKDWKWPEYAIPFYPRNKEERKKYFHIVSHVHPDFIDREKNEFDLLPTFRIPTLIHSRTNGAKWLYEISHTNPVWMNPVDAERLGVKTGSLVKVESEIGYFIDKVWVTEGIRPGVIAVSHHLGRWRLHEDHGSDRWNSALVRLEKEGSRWRMVRLKGVTPWASDDPDTSRIWWEEAGVHQNLIIPVQPDPISGMMCWHVKVRVERVDDPSRYGEVVVDTDKSFQVYKRWLGYTRPAPGPRGERRPYWMLRPLKPHPDAYRWQPQR